LLRRERGKAARHRNSSALFHSINTALRRGQATAQKHFQEKLFSNLLLSNLRAKSVIHGEKSFAINELKNRRLKFDTI
jgi:hypothetical protein